MGYEGVGCGSCRHSQVTGNLVSGSGILHLVPRLCGDDSNLYPNQSTPDQGLNFAGRSASTKGIVV